MPSSIHVLLFLIPLNQLEPHVPKSFVSKTLLEFGCRVFAMLYACTCMCTSEILFSVIYVFLALQFTNLLFCQKCFPPELRSESVSRITKQHHRWSHHSTHRKTFLVVPAVGTENKVSTDCFQASLSHLGTQYSSC